MAIFVPILKASGRLDQVHITIGIVGSRKLLQEDDYGSQGWEVFAPNLIIYGFDADADACAIANADLAERQVSWIEKHVPLALGRSVSEAKLYVTEHLACTSLYAPNQSYTDRFIGFQDSMQLNFTVDVELTTLDEFCKTEGITEIDFLQVDVQGADLDVLKGTNNLLCDHILGVQTEVEFSPLYVNQPLFAEVDTYLTAHGFSLFDLITDNTWCRVTRAISPLCSAKRRGQLLWADACYLQDPLMPGSPCKEPDRILKLACIADVLDFPDYALELLVYLTVHHGDNSSYNFAPLIVQVLSQFPDILPQKLENLPIMAQIRHRLSTN
jgi:FkbM family methyltransferase